MSPPPVSLPGMCASMSPCTSLSPRAAKLFPRSLGGRYRIADAPPLGEGSFAEVYRGRDSESGAAVAVKIYTRTDDNAVEHFRRTVAAWEKIESHADRCMQKRSNPAPKKESPIGRSKQKDLGAAAFKKLGRGKSFNTDAIMQGLQRKLGTNLDPDVMEHLVGCLDIRRCFAQILEYSIDEDGKPGIEEGSGLLWIVQELGGQSLEDEIAIRSEEQQPISRTELIDLTWSLVCITWGLHACGFVHMDIKPMNIIKFTSEPRDGDKRRGSSIAWKLIDLDGARLAHVPLERGSQTFCYTPVYMPPEMAQQIMNGGALIPSRLMDMWSVGMCVMQAIFGMPVLEPWYAEWAEETGNDEKFFRWLGDYGTDPIVDGDMKQHISSIDPGLCTILQGMLNKDPDGRLCSSSSLMHDVFAKYRAKLLRADPVLHDWAEVMRNGSSSEGSDGQLLMRPARSNACSVM